MSLSTKILLAAAVPLLVLGILLSIVYDRSAKQQVEQQYVEKARSIVLSAESMREEMASKWKQGIFSAGSLREWADAGQNEKILAAVPVVTAWKAAMMKATEGGYEVRVPKFQPRNPANEPDVVEARVLKMFETTDATEHYEIDTAKNAVGTVRREIVFATTATGDTKGCVAVTPTALASSARPASTGTVATAVASRSSGLVSM